MRYIGQNANLRFSSISVSDRMVNQSKYDTVSLKSYYCKCSNKSQVRYISPELSKFRRYFSDAPFDRI